MNNHLLHELETVNSFGEMDGVITKYGYPTLSTSLLSLLPNPTVNYGEVFVKSCLYGSTSFVTKFLTSYMGSVSSDKISEGFEITVRAAETEKAIAIWNLAHEKISDATIHNVATTATTHGYYDIFSKILNDAGDKFSDVELLADGITAMTNYIESSNEDYKKIANDLVHYLQVKQSPKEQHDKTSHDDKGTVFADGDAAQHHVHEDM